MLKVYTDILTYQRAFERYIHAPRASLSKSGAADDASGDMVTAEAELLSNRLSLTVFFRKEAVRTLVERIEKVVAEKANHRMDYLILNKAQSKWKEFEGLVAQVQDAIEPLLEQAAT